MATLNTITINLTRQAALGILVRSVKEEDEALIRLFWDLQYLYKFGLPELVPEVIPVDIIDPQSDPATADRLQVNEFILSQLVDVVAGDPNPQPNIQFLLRDANIRLSSARNFAKRLNSALKMVNREIEELEKQCT